MPGRRSQKQTDDPLRVTAKADVCVYPPRGNRVSPDATPGNSEMLGVHRTEVALWRPAAYRPVRGVRHLVPGFCCSSPRASVQRQEEHSPVWCFCM